MRQSIRALLLSVAFVLVGLTAVLHNLTTAHTASAAVPSSPQTPAGSFLFIPASWQTETVTSDIWLSADIAFDSNQHPLIAYHTYVISAGWGITTSLASWNGTTWQFDYIQALTGTDYIALDVDSNDNPHVFFDSNLGQRYAYWNGGWMIEAPNLTTNPQGLNMILDNNDEPHICTGGSTLEYAHWNQVIWDIQTVDDVGYVGDYCSIDLDSSNNPIISYYDRDNDDLKLARWDGAMWQIEVVDSVGDVGRFTSLAIDNSDHIHVAYHERIDTGSIPDNLKYAYFDGFTWDIQTIDSMGDGSYQQISLALDTLQNPHISYINIEDGLHYAAWTGSEWILQTVEAGATGSSFGLGLAINNENQSAIAYRANGDLHMAKAQVLTGTIPTSGSTFTPSLSETFTFPANAFADTVVLSYTRLAPLSQLPYVGILFKLEATYAESGQPAALEAGKSFTTTLNYDTNGRCINEDTLRVVFWRLKRQQQQSGTGLDLPPGWEAEATVVDTEANMVTAVVDELGVYSVFGQCNLYLSPIQN